MVQEQIFDTQDKELFDFIYNSLNSQDIFQSDCFVITDTNLNPSLYSIIYNTPFMYLEDYNLLSCTRFACRVLSDAYYRIKHKYEGAPSLERENKELKDQIEKLRFRNNRLENEAEVSDEHEEVLMDKIDELQKKVEKLQDTINDYVEELERKNDDLDYFENKINELQEKDKKLQEENNKDIKEILAYVDNGTELRLIKDSLKKEYPNEKFYHYLSNDKYIIYTITTKEDIKNIIGHINFIMTLYRYYIFSRNGIIRMGSENKKIV